MGPVKPTERRKDGSSTLPLRDMNKSEGTIGLHMSGDTSVVLWLGQSYPHYYTVIDGFRHLSRVLIMLVA
jgi:hypothetical protein